MASSSKNITVPVATPYVGEEPFFLYVGTEGSLVCKLVGDTAFSTFANIPNGFVFPGEIIEISHTSTVSDLVILK